MSEGGPTTNLAIAIRDGVELRLGDCLEVLPGLPEASAHAVVTDPPYGLRFMGRAWDHGVPGEPFWREVLRVVKPGAHLLAFGGTRTFHRLAVAIEDAGWEIRDTVMWVYGSGFPKSLDVSKAIDKAAGAEREVVGASDNGIAGGTGRHAGEDGAYGYAGSYDITAPATDAARRWSGWGTALKPAWEPIIVGRKPLAGTVAENVQEHGTGALNVDGCRIDTPVGSYDRPGSGFPDGRKNRSPIYEGGWSGVYEGPDRPHPDSLRHHALGRWPANLVHDGSEEVVGLFPERVSGGVPPSRSPREDSPANFLRGARVNEATSGVGRSSGSAARFFYCAKASRDDRTECGRVDNRHPTVKPTDLMRWLVRLVTPPGGLVLDPFAGSGSTGKAAVLEGCRFLGIDSDPDAIRVAERRLQIVAVERISFG